MNRSALVRLELIDFVHDIRRDVDAFVSGAEQSDDITMLAFDYKKI